MSHRHHICPIEAWDTGIQYIIWLLKQNGLTPQSSLLDVGCGCFRIGKQLIDFLDPAKYAGVEPCAPVLHAGIEKELGYDILAKKNPVFIYTPEFDFRPLNYPFTHVLASDVFIHCSARQFDLFLSRVKGVITAASKIIVTVNIGEQSGVLPKDQESNTLDEKVRDSKFLYQHAENNTTVYSAEEFDRIVTTNRFTHVTAAEFPLPCGKYVKHSKIITKV